MYTVLANTDPLQPDNVLYILNIGVYKHCLSTLYFVDRASRYNRVKKSQLDAQLILSIILRNVITVVRVELIYVERSQ